MVEALTKEAPTAPPSLVNTPEPEVKTPESALYPTTPPAKEVDAPPPDKTEAKAPTEPAKAEVPATPPAIPSEYDLKLSPDSPMTAEEQAALVKESKAAGLSKEEAEEVLKSHDAVARSTAARIRDGLKAEQDKALADAKVLWKGEIEKDPALGGEHLAETTLLASRGYHALTTPEDRKMIESVGMDYHPVFTRMMAKVGKLIGEDPRLVLGQVGGAPKESDPAKILYGKTTPGANGKTEG